jgi:hypothetical protein
MRYRTAAPSRSPRIFKADAGDVYLDAEQRADYEEAEEAFMLEMDDEPFEFETEIEPVSAEVIRELAATAVRDAQSALRQLAGDQAA